MSARRKPALRVTIFSDYICPFCYIGFLRLEKLRAKYDLEVNWRLIEIHPDNPLAGRPVSELGFSDAQWKEMMGGLSQMAAAEGIHLSGQSCTTNSHQALLLGEAAKHLGKDVFYAMHRRLFEAYLCEQKNIGDPAILKTLALEAGMTEETIEQAWNDPQYKNQLQQNLYASLELNVSGTPTYFIGTQKLVGVVPTDTLFRVAHETLTGDSRP